MTRVQNWRATSKFTSTRKTVRSASAISICTQHTGVYAADDYYWLKDLAEVSPLKVDRGDEIRVVRDVHNITPGYWSTINCWDIEVRLNAEID